MGLNNFTTKGGGSAEFTDVESDSITNSGTITSESVNPQFLAGSYLYAGNFSGSDPGSRLNNLLSTAQVKNSFIFLEDNRVNTSLSINSRCTVQSSPGGGFNESVLTIAADDVSVRGGIYNKFSGGELVLDATNITVSHTRFSKITLTSNSSKCVVFGNAQPDIVDNGSNNVIKSNS
jgi:hypothetical protein